MATIAEVRAKYPQYADMPDAALADALHKKFYSDIPRADFDAKIGLTAAPVAKAPAAPQGPSMYRKVREFVTPTVEALGAVGGGVLGTAGGPLGTVAGAGLGYAGAQELLRLADAAAGEAAPKETMGQAAARQAKTALEGATMEAGGRVAGQALGYLGGKVMDMRQIPQQKAAVIAKKAMGKDLPEVLNALRTAPDNVSVAELTAKIENPAWQALVKDALEKDPQFVRKARLLGETESLNALTRLAGGATATETRAAGETAKETLNALTGPMRETAIKRANLGQYVADDAAIRRAGDLAALTGSGTKIDPAQFVAQASGAEKALRSVGVKPLEGAPLADKITSITKNPSFAENDLIQGSVQQVSDGIRRWTTSGGVIDANALEAIRKNAVNAAIAKLRPGADATAQRNLAAGVMSKIKPMIDDAIEGAGGTGWRDYLATHAKGMQRISEQKLTGEALRLWKSDKDAFVRLVQNESPDVVEKFLGPGNYNIATELADSTMSALQKQAQKRLTDLSVKEQVSEGGAALSQLLKQQTSVVRVPSFLNFWASAGNKTLSELEKAVGAKTMTQLTQAMKTPQGAARLLETLPASERSRVLNLLSNPQQWKPGAAATAVNALAPQSENQNALVK